MRVCVVVAGDPDHRKMERKLPKKISIYRSCLKRTAKVCLYDSRVSNRFLRPHISSVYIKKPRGRVQERLIRRVISTCKALFFVPYVVAAMRETNGFFFFGVWVNSSDVGQTRITRSVCTFRPTAKSCFWAWGFVLRFRSQSHATSSISLGMQYVCLVAVSLNWKNGSGTAMGKPTLADFICVTKN